MLANRMMMAAAEELLDARRLATHVMAVGAVGAAAGCDGDAGAGCVWRAVL